MPKGKYYGPDKYKGVIPKGYKGKGKGKYFGPEKYKGKAQSQKTTLKDQAKELTDKQYAGIEKEIEDSRKNNLSNYEDWVKQRQASYASEVASNTTAGSIVQNVLLGLKGKAMEGWNAQEAARVATQAVVKAANQATNQKALADFQAQMEARGISAGGTRDQMEAGFAKQLGFADELDAIRNTLNQKTQNTREEMSNAYVGQAANATTMAQGNAAARAAADMNQQYSEFNQRRQTLDTAAAKTALDKGSAELNTYLTLKREAEQRKAEQQQAQLEAAVAMGKQSSADYFREAELGLDTQKFLHTVQRDTDRLTLDTRKQDAKEKIAGITYPNRNIRITSPSAPAAAQRFMR